MDFKIHESIIFCKVLYSISITNSRFDTQLLSGALFRQPEVPFNYALYLSNNELKLTLKHFGACGRPSSVLCSSASRGSIFGHRRSWYTSAHRFTENAIYIAQYYARRCIVGALIPMYRYKCIRNRIVAYTIASLHTSTWRIRQPYQGIIEEWSFNWCMRDLSRQDLDREHWMLALSDSESD